MRHKFLVYRLRYRRNGSGQRGVALFVVIIFMTLSVLLALWASRSALFGEMVVGNDADYQRAFEAAQALMQDAELDIRGENADGTKCTPDGNDEKICRENNVPDQIPLEAKEVGSLFATLSELPIKCRNGLCIKRSAKQDFWNNSDPPQGISLALMTGNQGSPASSIGARYGMFTGAKLKGPDGEPANPILADRSAANKGGWYWIEVLPYDESSKNSELIVKETTNPDGTQSISASSNYVALNMLPNVVYRITAVAYGRKPNSMAVLQQSYARQKLKD